MAKYTDQEKQELMSISIVEILAYYGKSLARTKTGMYFSPFRDEKTPSFHIDESANTWYDFGSHEGGGLIDFVCKITGCQRKEAYDWLASIRNMIPESVHTEVIKRATSVSESKVIIEKVNEQFRKKALIEYAQSRCIPKDILDRYCDEISYSVTSKPDSHFYAIGFKNNSGGYVLRSKVAKICSSSDITTLGPDGKHTQEVNSKKVVVFEGFIDFLSLLSYNEKVEPGHDCCILNSVSNLERALPWIARHEKIMVFADNDNAGKDTLKKIRDCVSASAEDVCVYDMAELYEGHKDLNDKLVDEMNGTEQSSINTKHHGTNTI